MPKTMDVTLTAAADGTSGSKRVTVSADNKHSTSRSVPAAKTGNLTTRTDNDTGELTMDPGHGIGTGNKLDVYWIDPTTLAVMSRVNMTVGTVAGDTVPIDGGTGDNLPLAASEITASVPVVETVNLNIGAAGVNVQGIRATGARSAAVAVFEGATLLGAHRMNASADGGVPSSDIWAVGVTGDNPYGTAVGAANTIALSNGDSTQAAEVTIDILYN